MRWKIKTKSIGSFCYRLTGHQQILGMTNDVTADEVVGRIAGFLPYLVSEVIGGNTQAIGTKTYGRQSVGMLFSRHVIIIQ